MESILVIKIRLFDVKKLCCKLSFLLVADWFDAKEI